MTALPNSSNPSGPGMRPGGMRRFIIAMLVTLLLLSGVVIGMAYWMKVTGREEIGPEKLKFPENRYYRQKPS